MVTIKVECRKGEVPSWNLVKLRETLAGDPKRRRTGDRPADRVRIGGQRGSLINFPKMLNVKGQTYKRIMVGELTDTEASQVLKPEEVSGHNAAKLQASLKEPSGKPLAYTNVDDAVNYIKELNSQGRKFRFMTDAEFDALLDEVKSQLKGKNWFLVETSRGSGQYYWRSLNDADRDYDFDPDERCDDGAVRLVED